MGQIAKEADILDLKLCVGINFFEYQKHSNYVKLIDSE